MFSSLKGIRSADDFMTDMRLTFFLFRAATIFTKNVNSLNKFETSFKNVYNNAENRVIAVKKQESRLMMSLIGAPWRTLPYYILLPLPSVCFVAAEASIRKSIIKLITLLVCSAA